MNNAYIVYDFKKVACLVRPIQEKIMIKVSMCKAAME